MDTRKRVLQANLNNQEGAFSVAYEAQKELQDEYIFDYFFPDRFVKNSIYEHLLSMGSKCVGEIESGNRFLKQVTVYKSFYKYLCENHYDIVHIHSDTAWKISVYYLAAKKAHIKKIVVHSHSSGINGHHHKINYLMHILTKPIVKSSKYKCACSDVAAQWMFDTSKNVSIIRNGVDTPFLIVGCVYLTLGTFMSTGYTVHKDSKGFLMSGLFGGVLNIILNFLLIPIIGVYGAALATCISYISVFAFRVFNTRKYMKYKVLTKEFLIGSLALTVSGILIYSNDIIAQTIQILILLIVIELYKEIWLRLWNKVINKI